MQVNLKHLVLNRRGKNTRPDLEGSTLYIKGQEMVVWPSETGAGIRADNKRATGNCVELLWSLSVVMVTGLYKTVRTH